MGKIFIPTRDAKCWKRLLAKPEEHWKPKHSAMALAACWEQSKDFPKNVKDTFHKSGLKLFQEVEMLLALPEYKVDLVGSNISPSQNDIFVLAKGDNQLIAIVVEGKVKESFDKPVSEWKRKTDEKTNKPQRLRFLLDLLGLSENDVETIGYQLLHRTASAVLIAEKFLTPNALMLVHSFCQEDSLDHFEDYSKFLSLFKLIAERNKIAGPVNVKDVNLYFGWAKGEKKYLEMDLRV